ncbi:MAG: hypothetical protein KAX49_03525 [Halanaerobiales bacterium]|nr:hypothetical protein [Halanaerobiales bacterium]
MMKINKEKSIGRVLFIVEGGKTEFSLLRRIFCNVLGYEYIEKRRNKANFFRNKNISTSKVAVINTEESNISDILDKNNYLDDVFATLISEYSFPVDKAAIYYLFDRDPNSNIDSQLIRKLILDLKNPYDNDELRGGMLLLSYPSIESYNISSFVNDAHVFEIRLGSDAKAFIASNNHIQVNKINDNTIEKAAEELIKYMNAEGISNDIDDFSQANLKIFNEQENNFSNNSKYRVLSLLSVAFMQLGIIEFD